MVQPLDKAIKFSRKDIIKFYGFMVMKLLKQEHRTFSSFSNQHMEKLKL